MAKPVFTAQSPLLKSFLIAFLFICSNAVWGQVDLVRWGNQTSPFPPSYTASNITASNITAVEGITITPVSYDNLQNWFQTGGWPTGNDNGGGIGDASKYIEFSISPNNGYKIDLDKFNFYYQAQGTTQNFQVRYSKDDFNSYQVMIADTIIPNTNWTSASNSFSSVNPVLPGEVVKIRIYVYNTWNNFNIKRVYDSNQPNDYSQTPTITGTVTPLPTEQSDLEIEKTVSNANPEVDDNVTFTITTTNNGPDDATGVTVTDVLPTGYDFVSSTQGTYNAGTRTITWNVGNLAASASTSFDIDATVLASGTYNNTASVTANEPDPDTDNNNDTVTVTPDIPTANLEITKTVDDNSPSVSQNITFTLTVTNNGPDDATGVTVTDELPSGYTYVNHSTEDGSFDEGTGEWTIGNLSNGNSATLTITATVLPSGNHTNTATVTANEFDPATGNNTDSETISIDYGTTDLEIQKIASHFGNDNNRYSYFGISVRNNGPQAATNIEVEDILNSVWNFTAQAYVVSHGTVTATGTQSRNISWEIPYLPSGGVAVLLFRTGQNTNFTDPWTTGRNNTATIIAMDQSDSNVANNSVTTMSTAYWSDHLFELGVTKSVSPANPYIGEEVQFTIVVEKTGISTSGPSNLQVLDKLPPGYAYVSSSATDGGSYNSATGVWTLGTSWDWSGTRTLTITAKVNAPTGVPDEYKNVASIFSAGEFADTEINNNMASATIPTPVADPASTDLSITKTVNNASPTVLSNVVFTLTAKNNGPNDTTGVVVDDLLPVGFAHVSDNGAGAYNPNTGKWNVGALANGASKTLIITAKVIDTENRAVEDYTNTATISGDRSDSNPGNNEDDAVVTPFFPEADLQITSMTISNPNPLVGGGDVTFTINVINNGPDNALGVSVDALLPSGYQYVGNTRSTGSYNNATGIWTIGNLADGAAAYIEIDAQVLATGEYTFNSEITGAVEDNVENNTGSETIDNIVDLAITKVVTSSPTPDIGDLVTFEITVDNVGINPATGVVIKDVIPSGYNSGSSDVTAVGGTYDPVTKTATWNISELDPADPPVSFTLTTTVRAGGNHNNTATVSAQQGDDEPDNNSDGESVTPNISDAVDLKVTQSVDNDEPDITATDGSVTFTITAKNAVVMDEAGNGLPLNPASNVQVNLQLAEGLQYESFNTLTGSFDAVSKIWNIGALNDSISVTLDITVSIPGGENVIEGAPYLSIAEITADEAAYDNNIINNRAYSIVTPEGQDLLECDVNAENPVFSESFGSGVATFGGELPDGRTNLTYFEPPNPPGTYDDEATNYVADGRYVIGHNANDAFNVWKNIPDHTGLTNGYYMIMNASLEPHEFFRMQIDLADEFCSNTQYTVSVWVANVNSEADLIYCTGTDPSGELKLPEIGYFVQNNNGVVLGAGTSGKIAYSPDAEWVEYTFIFTTSEDDQYVDLVLFNQALGGCGNDLAIDDITVYACMTPPVRLDMQIESNQLEVCGGEDVIMSVIEEPDPEIENDDYAWPPTAWEQDPNEPGYVVYQWQKSENADDPDSWVDIPGANTDTYTIEDFQIEDQAYYRLLYAQGGNMDKASCRFPSDDLFPMFNATPVIPPIEIIEEVSYICGDDVPDGTIQLYTNYDTSAYVECDENGENCESTWGEDFYLWESSDSGVATINQDGLVTAVDTGTTTITYTVWSPKGSCWDSVTKDISVLADCPTCVEEPTDIITGGDPSKIGISTLDDQLAAWPGNIPNGFIVLESKEKGFVITRVANTSTVTIAEPVEGMLVYDEADKCIKLYNGSEWNCIEQECDEVP